MTEIGNDHRQEAGKRLNNRAENSHQPFRRRESAVGQVRCLKTLQKFTSAHGSGPKLPVVLTRRMSWIGADGLAGYRRYACLIELSCSTASTSRSLRSDDKGAGIVPAQ
ncbi:MAG: DDE-type integrase/transposase/recombinase [Geminicoccales bacterium]